MATGPGFLPLYKQVYQFLLERIVDGTWKPGQALPNEFALANELNVSQGTVRKALNVMESEQLIERRQGKGTFVIEHTQETSLFKFFRLARDNGERALPDSEIVSVKPRAATSKESQKLGLARAGKVVDICRVREVDGVPALWEHVVLSRKAFPGIERRKPLPNALYALYQRDYGISIATANERVTACVARREDVKRLNVKLGTPLLLIEREAISIEAKCIELRTSRCDTRLLHYDITLS